MGRERLAKEYSSYDMGHGQAILSQTGIWSTAMRFRGRGGVESHSSSRVDTTQVRGHDEAWWGKAQGGRGV